MKYQYKFRFIEFPSGGRFLTIDLPDKIGIVTGLLTQIYNHDQWYIEGINDVLLGLKDFQTRESEFYGLEIRKDFTRIYDIYNEGNEGIIETSELKELIEIWAKEYKRIKQGDR